jgi:PDZ domain
LKLDDEKLFDKHPPLRRAPELPDVKEAVMAYGYPTGGSNLSITKGIVENPALRGLLKLAPGVEGIVVHDPYPRGGGSPLRTWDVITKIGDSAVDDQGMVQVGPNLRIRFQYLVQRLAKEGRVSLSVVRAGKTLTVELPVSPTHPMLIPDRPGEYPPYFIYGPLVFSSVSTESVASMRGIGGLGALSSPVYTRALDPPAFPGEELVEIPAPFFTHKLAKGYSNPMNSVIKAVNGVAIKNLRHLVEVLRDSSQEFLVFEVARRWGETCVFSRQEMETATEEILTDNGIRSQGSADLMKIWNAKPRR